jgi:esterase/lipase
MKTIINSFVHEDFEVLEYTSTNAKKLMFLQHGIYGKKEKIMNLLGVSFVKLGYHVVAIDAYKHGYRGEEPFINQDKDQAELMTMDVVKHTANDIKTLYETYYQNFYPAINIVGISMGGLIAYYLSTIIDQMDQLVALISSPKFLDAANYTFPKERQALYDNSEEALKKVESMDPSKQVTRMNFERLIMFNGTNDTVIPYTQSKSFYEKHKDLNIVFKTYDAEHKITKEMHEDLLALLKKES